MYARERAGSIRTGGMINLGYTHLLCRALFFQQNTWQRFLGSSNLGELSAFGVKMVSARMPNSSWEGFGVAFREFDVKILAALPQ